MIYDMCLNYTVKGGAPTDSDPGWASEYVIYLFDCIVYLLIAYKCWESVIQVI